MSILINNDSSTPQPSMLIERYVQIQSQNESIAGYIQRNRIGQKKEATLTYESISPTDYQNLINKFTTGSGVLYYNSQSAKTGGGVFTFSGLPYFDESPYVAGASLLQESFVVRIREQ